MTIHLIADKHVRDKMDYNSMFNSIVTLFVII